MCGTLEPQTVLTYMARTLPGQPPVFNYHSLLGSVLEHGMRVPIFSDPCGQEFTYEAPTRRVIARNPTLQDPWEDQVCSKKNFTNMYMMIRYVQRLLDWPPVVVG